MRLFQATSILPFSFWFATADHDNGFHWGRTSNPFTIQVIKSIIDTDVNVWNDEFDLALDVWRQSEVIEFIVVSEETSLDTRQECTYVSGKIRVCNADYGETGWLGIASYRAYIFSDEKLTNAARVRFNDYYEMDENERKHVACHELGHVLGLGHTSEDGSSQSTCMDYSNSPDSVGPNNNDYQELLQIYQHVDSQSTIAQDVPPSVPTPTAGASLGNPTPQPVIAPSPSPVTSAPSLRPVDNGGGGNPNSNNGGGGGNPNTNSTCISRGAGKCEDEGEFSGGNNTGHVVGNGNTGNTGNRGPPPHAAKFGLPEQASAVAHDRFSASYELRGEKDEDGVEFVEHFNVLYAVPISQEEWEDAASFITTTLEPTLEPTQEQQEYGSGSADTTFFGLTWTVVMAISASFLL